MFLLDTEHIAVLQAQRQPDFGRLVQRMSQHPPRAFYFSIVSFHEQALGANLYVNRAQTPQGVVQGYDLFWQILQDYATAQVLPFDAAAAALFVSLRGQKIRIGTMDLRIAAIALLHQLIVLTSNGSDFTQVPGLKVEDWTV